MSHNNPAIIISADSTMDMPPEFIEKYSIAVIPSYVSLGDQEYDDYPHIQQKDLFRFFETSGKLPQTSSANPWDYKQHFEKLTANGSAVIHISKSSLISSSWKNADTAAMDMENVYVVDSKNLSGGSGMLAREASECGITDPAALVEHLESYRSRIEGSFIIENLTYLKEGGRCSSIAALGANLLKLRPEIAIIDGEMRVVRKYRGRFESCIDAYLKERLKNVEMYEPDVAMMSHTLQDPALLQHTKDVLAARGYFREIMEYPAGAAVSCHCGPNTYGVFFIKKPE